MAGAADRHLAGAEVGERQPHHPRQPQRQGLRRIHGRGGQATTAREASLFAIWNEPNDIASLQPQFNASGQPVSPRIYRGLYQAGYAGLQAAGLAHPEGADGRNGAGRRRQPQPLGNPQTWPAPRRRAAGVPARRAVPQLPLQESGRLRIGAGVRLLHPRLHPEAGPPVGALGARTTSRSGRSTAWKTRSTAPRARARSGRASRSTSPSSGCRACPTATRACRSPNRPNTTRSPNTSPGKTRAWRPSRSTCCTTTPPAAPRARASTAAPSASRRAWSTSTAAPSRSTRRGRSRWSSPSWARLLAVGPGAPGERLDQGDDPRQDARREEVPRAEDRHHRIARLLELRLERGGRVLESELDEPHGREVRRAGDRGHARSIRRGSSVSDVWRTASPA